ncbi:unnamed protein product [Withania somnifera]
MATPPDSSANNNTPSSPAVKTDGVFAVSSESVAGVSVSSPQSRRSLQAPWAQVVRRGESEVVSVSSPRSPSPLTSVAGVSPEKILLSDDCLTQKTSPEIGTSGDLTESCDSNDGNVVVGRPKKPAWNKPLNGVVEAVSVMGGSVTWPALSESTRPGPKSSTELSKPIPDGSASVSQKSWKEGGNFGGRPRGDGSYHNNHGGRRDQDRRDVHMAPQFAPPHGPFLRPPHPGTAPYLPPPPPMRPFAAPMGFEMGPYFYISTLNPEPYGGVPIITQAPQLPQHLPLVDPKLPPSLVNQIEYYFSDANLVKDDFLRSQMDEEGWVPIKLIANFPRVKTMTEKVQSDNIQFILYCLRVSTFVEVQDEKVRRRDGWRKWTHTSGQPAADSGSSTPVASTDGCLIASLQNVSLNESATNTSSAIKVTDAQLEVAPGGLSDVSTNQSKPAQEEGSADAEENSTNHA